MCRVMEKIHNDGYTEGKTDGRNEGIESERLRSIKSLVQSFGITADAAMNALGISKEERPKYLALL